MKRTTLIIMVILAAAQIYSVIAAERSHLQKPKPVDATEDTAPYPQPIE